ncbi:MAG: serine O-acetyltransferase [Armatimonadetes bacterium]|nr:serine O-acetyltransferase [Armatimonadota bacterium]NIO75133.1 serine O-acetyltransferase [Armatimonadota bacterium]NIO95757.1 serine O-acetyltransferase [Armatimonadota bacterium]
MFSNLRRDIAAAMERDPAARSALEVLLCYSGLHAILMHRFSHCLWTHKLRLMARFVSQLGRWLTGVEIHPAARIGPGLFIDHGMGVVIGETSEIGKNVLVFQGVTLGGTGKEHGKRHPTIGDNVVIGVGAKVLGAITIGENSVVGAGAVVLKSVPPNCTAVGVPARVVREEGERIMDLRHERLPDPVTEVFRTLNERINLLERQISTLQEQAAQTAQEKPPSQGNT